MLRLSLHRFPAADFILEETMLALLFLVVTVVVARTISMCLAHHQQRVVSKDMSGVGVAKLYKAEKATSTRHGCRSPPTLHVHWPFGLDRLKQMVQADAELRLMQLFLFHFQQTGSTLEQKFLGTKVFGTMEPANLEAVLSTQAKGRCSPDG